MNDTRRAFRADTSRSILCFVTALLWGSGCAQPHIQPLTVQRWQGWENLQGNARGADCLSIAPNAIDCFARDAAGLTERRRWDGTTWLPWTQVQGVVMESFVDSKPECVSSSVSRIDCFVRADADKALYHRFWESNVVSGWEALGGTLASDPECVSATPQEIDCYARGSNGELLHRHFDGNIWAPWENLGGQIADGTKPGCASPGQGRIECMVTWTDEHLRHRRFGTAPTGWSPAIGGRIVGPQGFPAQSPKCYASPAANRVDCVGPQVTNSGSASLGRFMFDGQNMSGMDLESDFGRSVGVHSLNVKSYDWDCVERSNDRLDCMELVVWWGGSYTSNVPGVPFFRHLSVVPNEPIGWINVTLTPIAWTEPRSIDCVSWDGDRIDCFVSGWAGSGFQSPLAHASYTWQRILPGGRLPPP